MSKKTLKPKKLKFFATFVYGLLFWIILLSTVLSTVFIVDPSQDYFGMGVAIFVVLALATIGMGILRKVRRRNLSLKLPIEPKDIPYTADEVKHYLGLQSDDNFSEEYYAMVRAFNNLRKSKMAQIITSVEEIKEYRSAAKASLTTYKANIKARPCPVLFLKQEVPTFLDKDRNTYFLLPHFIIRIAGKKNITAFSYSDFELDYNEGSLVLDYEDKVPRDTEIIGQAYEHSNNDGSPDARYSDNPSTPIIQTGQIHIYEYWIHYQFSNNRLVEEFDEKFKEFAAKAIDAENLKRALKEAARQVQNGQMEVSKNEE